MEQNNINNKTDTTVDYESARWIPELKFGGQKTGITYATQLAQYTRINNTVFFSCELGLKSKGSSIGNSTIEGLPFVSSVLLSNSGAMGEIDHVAIGSGNVWMWVLPPSSTSISLRISSDDSSRILMNDSYFSDNSIVIFSGIYYID